jgi:glycosyltransferase involved in cell wall biosynthesis
MIRVAHVMAGAVHGGAELFFERLCLAQAAAGDAVLPVIRHNAARAALLREAGMNPLELSFGTRLDLFTRPALRRALHAFRPRVAVAWMSRANMHLPRGDWVNVGRLGGYYDLRYYRACDHLVGNTHGIVAWLRRQGWAAERTHYLPNFVADFGDTGPATDLPPGRPLLLALGRLHADKGFDTAIRALVRLPGATLAIAGEGPERAALEALARAEGVAARVHFLGWRNDAGALLRAADLFVCSSRVEPLGNMVIEAWSARRPLVAVAADGPAELIRDGEDGLLVPHENPAALAAAIERALASPGLGARLAEGGRRRFEAEFTEARVLARWRGFLAGVER